MLTDEERMTICDLVTKHVVPKFGNLVPRLHPESDGNYSLVLKRAGAPESEAKTFTVFVDQLRNSLETGQLPEGLLRSFTDDLNRLEIVQPSATRL